MIFSSCFIFISLSYLFDKSCERHFWISFSLSLGSLLFSSIGIYLIYFIKCICDCPVIKDIYFKEINNTAISDNIAKKNDFDHKKNDKKRNDNSNENNKDLFIVVDNQTIKCDKLFKFTDSYKVNKKSFSYISKDKQNLENNSNKSNINNKTYSNSKRKNNLCMTCKKKRKVEINEIEKILYFNVKLNTKTDDMEIFYNFIEKYIISSVRKMRESLVHQNIYYLNSLKRKFVKRNFTSEIYNLDSKLIESYLKNRKNSFENESSYPWDLEHNINREQNFYNNTTYLAKNKINTNNLNDFFVDSEQQENTFLNKSNKPNILHLENEKFKQKLNQYRVLLNDRHFPLDNKNYIINKVIKKVSFHSPINHQEDIKIINNNNINNNHQIFSHNNNNYLGYNISSDFDNFNDFYNDYESIDSQSNFLNQKNNTLNVNGKDINIQNNKQFNINLKNFFLNNKKSILTKTPDSNTFHADGNGQNQYNNYNESQENFLGEYDENDDDELRYSDARQKNIVFNQNLENMMLNEMPKLNLNFDLDIKSNINNRMNNKDQLFQNNYNNDENIKFPLNYFNAVSNSKIIDDDVYTSSFKKSKTNYNKINMYVNMNISNNIENKSLIKNHKQKNHGKFAFNKYSISPKKIRKYGFNNNLTDMNNNKIRRIKNSNITNNINVSLNNQKQWFSPNKVRSPKKNFMPEMISNNLNTFNEEILRRNQISFLKNKTPIKSYIPGIFETLKKNNLKKLNTEVSPVNLIRDYRLEKGELHPPSDCKYNLIAENNKNLHAGTNKVLSNSEKNKLILNKLINENKELSISGSILSSSERKEIDQESKNKEHISTKIFPNNSLNLIKSKVVDEKRFENDLAIIKNKRKKIYSNQTVTFSNYNKKNFYSQLKKMKSENVLKSNFDNNSEHEFNVGSFTKYSKNIAKSPVHSTRKLTNFFFNDQPIYIFQSQALNNLKKESKHFASKINRKINPFNETLQANKFSRAKTQFPNLWNNDDSIDENEEEDISQNDNKENTVFQNINKNGNLNLYSLLIENYEKKNIPNNINFDGKIGLPIKKISVRKKESSLYFSRLNYFKNKSKTNVAELKPKNYKYADYLKLNKFQNFKIEESINEDNKQQQ